MASSSSESRNAIVGAITPEPEMCDNCGTALAGPYCHQCGQHDVDHLASVPEFIVHLAEAALGYDSRLLRTARALFTRPGLLTAEYLAGRRARYVSPLQTYLAAAAILFATNTLRPIVTFDVATHSFRSEVATLGFFNVLTDAELAALAARGMSLDLYGERFSSATTSLLSSLLVLLVPVFAVLVATTFVRRRGPFAHHVLFSLHWSAFSLMLLAALQILPRWLVTGLALPLVVLGPMLYFVVALRRAYALGWGGAAVRGVPLFLFYQACVIAWLEAVTLYTRYHI